VQSVATDDFQPVRVVTWNISGKDKSQYAPEDWGEEDKLAAVAQEVKRWGAEIVALQECPSARGLLGLQPVYDLVGAQKCHHHDSFVHLYVRKGIDASGVKLVASCPCVLGQLGIRGSRVDVIAAHLEAGAGNASVRQGQVRAAFDKCRHGNACVLLGDLNVREEEVEELRKIGDFGDAPYSGLSWDPKRNRYHADKGRTLVLVSAMIVSGLLAEHVCRLTLSGK
jgi:endonuclease/exonuclease/phosphatase family metal-dependent hydrolase